MMTRAIALESQWLCFMLRSISPVVKGWLRCSVRTSSQWTQLNYSACSTIPATLCSVGYSQLLPWFKPALTWLLCIRTNFSLESFHHRRSHNHFKSRVSEKPTDEVNYKYAHLLPTLPIVHWGPAEFYDNIVERGLSVPKTWALNQVSISHGRFRALTVSHTQLWMEGRRALSTERNEILRVDSRHWDGDYGSRPTDSRRWWKGGTVCLMSYQIRDTHFQMWLP